jgi:hypothetical protein
MVKNWLIKFKKEKLWGKAQMLGPILIIILAVVATAYLSFQYFLIANFPIGRDVITHIMVAQQIQQHSLLYAFKSSIYPLAYFAFIFWHKILILFGLSWQSTFIFFECANLFLVSILTGVLSYRISKDWRVAAVTMVLVASSRWLNDSLRIGLAAESFGWIFFMAALIMLFEKKWLWFLLAAVILFFSHPLPFGVLMVIFFGFVIFWIFTISGKTRWKLLAVPICLLILLLLGRVFLPSEFHRIFMIVKFNFPIEGERSVFNYIVDSDKRRLLFYFFSFLGFATLALGLIKKKWEKIKAEKIWLLLIFSFLAFLICFKHYFGIHYLGYRYYTYFEIAASILAAFGAVKISQIVWPKLSFLIYIPLTLLLVCPNWSATKAITIWQLNTPSLQDSTPIGDQKSLPEIAKILKPKTRIYSHSSWHTWLKIDGFSTLGDWGAPNYAKLYGGTDLDRLRQYLVDRNYSYIYFSSADPVSPAENANFLTKIYDQNNVRVYQVK